MSALADQSAYGEMSTWGNAGSPPVPVQLTAGAEWGFVKWGPNSGLKVSIDTLHFAQCKADVWILNTDSLRFVQRAVDNFSVLEL